MTQRMRTRRVMERESDDVYRFALRMYRAGEDVRPVRARFQMWARQGRLLGAYDKMLGLCGYAVYAKTKEAVVIVRGAIAVSDLGFQPARDLIWWCSRFARDKHTRLLAATVLPDSRFASALKRAAFVQVYPTRGALVRFEKALRAAE